MPSTSKAQHNLMAAVANNPAFAKKTGIPQSVGKDFMQADKGKKIGSGIKSRQDSQSINRPKTDHGKSALLSEGGDMKTKHMASGGMAPTKMGKPTAGGSRPHGEHTVQQKGHTKAAAIKMAGARGMKRGGKC